MVAEVVVGLLALAVASVRADCAGGAGTQPVWAQCGGIGWNGGTTCVNGAECLKQNDWYSQCLPCKATITQSPGSSSASATSTSATSTATSPGGPAGAIKHWFVFGDSYTQTQFNYTSTQPSAGNPFGNPPYPGFTACGSVPNWIDLAIVKYNTSSKLAYNFAYGGATVNATLVPPYTPSVLSLIDQVNQFTAGYTGAANRQPAWSGDNTFVATWIGINDIGNSYYQPGDRAAFNGVLVEQYFAQMARVAAAGARNFVFLNVPPVDRSPLMLPQSGAAQEKVVINDFNAKVAARAAAFAASNPGVKTWVVDTNTLVGGLLNAPQANGFSDATSYGSQAGVMWCNNYHISPGVHDFVAREVQRVLAGTGAL